MKEQNHLNQTCGQSQVLIIVLKTLAIEPHNTPLCSRKKGKRERTKNFFVLSPSGLVTETTKCLSVAIFKPFQECLTSHIN